MRHRTGLGESYLGHPLPRVRSVLNQGFGRPPRRHLFWLCSSWKLVFGQGDHEDTVKSYLRARSRELAHIYCAREPSATRYSLEIASAHFV